MGLDGKSVARIEVEGNGLLQEIPFDLDNVPAGIYMVHLITSSGASTSKLVITD